MKILWITNLKVVIDIERKQSSRGGWMEGALRQIQTEKSLEIVNAYPQILGNDDKKSLKINQRIEYYPIEIKNEFRYSDHVKKQFERVYKEVNPDIIHIWGTEYAHSLAAVKAANNIGIQEKVVINLQGLVSVYAKHYFAEVPFKYRIGMTIKDIRARSSLLKEAKKIADRGLDESTAIKEVLYVIGRTDWDKACAVQMNPTVKYYFCNEILRESFYESKKWDFNACKKYSLFITQAHSPIKGMHQILKALPIIKQHYPQVKLYVAGISFLEKNHWYNELTSYEKYLFFLIKKNEIFENIEFLGDLSESKIYNHFLSTHVFVSPSIIENESNSLSEAKILGVPTVSAYVGGVTSRVEHAVDGYTYPFDEPYMLAYYIMQIFSDNERAKEISRNAIANAEIVNSKKNNKQRLLEIYDEIMKHDMEGLK